jgi:hypothetical protein
VVAGSQLGHAITYLVRYGAAAATLQSEGVHAYFPALTAIISGVVGGGLMTALLLFAAARVLTSAPAAANRHRAHTVFDILPVLFAVQMVLFIGQESIEMLVAGGAVPSVAALLLWGAVGQLPAALAGSVIVSWLLVTIETAVSDLIAGGSSVLSLGITPAQAAPSRLVTARIPTPLEVYSAAYRKRGPPVS